MAPSTKQLSQKEYLKKYLSKKKKKKPGHRSRRENVKLIDDDAISRIDDNHFEDLEDGEDAPVIAGFYDERPTEIKLLENYRNANRWQPVPGVDKESDGGRSSPSSKRGRLPRDDYSPAPHRRERHEEDSRNRKRKHQSSQAASPPRSKHRSELSSPIRRTPPREERRIEERVVYSPSRRGDRSKLDERRMHSDLGQRFRVSEHSPRRPNSSRFNGSGGDGGDRYRHEEQMQEDRYAGRSRQRPRSVDSGSPDYRPKRMDEEHRAPGRRMEARLSSPLPPPPSSYADRMGRFERPMSPAAAAHRKDHRLPDDRRYVDDVRREHHPMADHHRMQPPPHLSKSQRSRRLSDAESPPPARHRSSNRGDERMLSRMGVGHRHESPPPRGDRRLSPPRNERRLSPPPRACLDDRSRRRSFSPMPSRRYHSPTAPLPPLDGHYRADRRDDRSPAGRGPPQSRTRHERVARDPPSPGRIRKDNRRHEDDSRSPSLLSHHRRKERLPRDDRDPRDRRYLPRDLQDLRDVFVDPRTIRDGRDPRELRDERDLRDPRDLREALRDGRDLRAGDQQLHQHRHHHHHHHRGEAAPRDAREPIRMIEWKERADVISHGAPSRRAVGAASPPRPSSPPPQPARRESPHRNDSSSSSAHKRKNKKPISSAASASGVLSKKEAAAASKRHREGGGGGGKRREIADSPPPPPPPSSPPPPLKHRAVRHESSAASSPKHRGAAAAHPRTPPTKYRDASSEQQRFHVAHKRNSTDGEHRGRRTPDEPEAGAASNSTAEGHIRLDKRPDEKASAKVTKERDREGREHKKSEKSLRQKDEKFGLLSTQKSATKAEDKLTDEQAGKNATTIYRDAKTGKKRDLQAEKLEKIEKRRREEEKKEQYYQWGRGLKQVEEEKEKISEELYEMSKPLARYADDDDLDKTLKQKEISSDPMLEYINRKKRKKEAVDGKVTKPKYKGSWPPNRFNIPPGHKWDGVDRSNGFEGRYFAKQSEKKAMEEEAYKWCSEDM